MRRVRFVGGPEHGKIRAIQNDYHQTFCFPVYEQKIAWASESLTFSDYKTREVVYERRQVQLGPWARVELWAPCDMPEPEFFRRVADLLEGVGDPITR